MNQKYNDLVPLVITSNLSIVELAEHVGDRTASRLVEMCTFSICRAKIAVFRSMRDIRSYRPVFLREEMERRIDFKSERHCIGFKDDGSSCDNLLEPYKRYYCSGECMENAQKNGTYRSG